MSSSSLDTVESRKIRYAQELAAYSFRQFQDACHQAELRQRERDLAQLQASTSSTSPSTPRVRSHSHPHPRTGPHSDPLPNHEEKEAAGTTGGGVVGASRSSPPSDPTTPKERKPIPDFITVDYAASVDGHRDTTRKEENR